MPRLRRMGDGAGDMGSCSQAIKKLKNGNIKVVGYKPTVGCAMLVGSATARSYSNQDYWITSPVTEIIEDSGEYVKFKTGNSIYEWHA